MSAMTDLATHHGYGLAAHLMLKSHEARVMRSAVA